MILLLISAGLFFILSLINSRIDTQIKLDQKTGSTALKLRASLISLEDSFHRLEVARIATLSGCVNIPACPSYLNAFKFEVQIENKIQTAIETIWNAESIHWITYHPLLMVKSKFPEFPVTVVNPNEWQLEMLKVTHFTFQSPDRISLTLKQQSLISTAEIRTTKQNFSHHWQVAWVQ